MHDPRLSPGLASSYKIDATPARHTQTSAWTFEGGDGAFPGLSAHFALPERYAYAGKGNAHRVVSAFGHVLNAAGICLFGAYVTPYTSLQDSLSAVMGREFTFEDVLNIGDRIAALRMAFNAREGLRSKDFEVPGRMIGRPPLDKGPLAGVTIDLDQQLHDYFVAMGWDTQTGLPTQETLTRLGLDFVAKEMYA